MERKLQELRERLWLATVPLGGATDKYAAPWNDAFNTLIDYIAEKDAEIARLEAEARRLHDLRYERDAEILRLKVALAEPRKVSDAQRERMRKATT